jgi:hypothetical protein
MFTGVHRDEAEEAVEHILLYEGHAHGHGICTAQVRWGIMIRIIIIWGTRDLRCVLLLV